MKVLLIGHSDIAARRVLPALCRAGVEQVEVASTSARPIAWPGAQPPRRYDTYEAALDTSDADLVYISTVNSTHARWATRALERGFHVAVDKPAFLGLDEARAVAALASRQRRCLAEATVYAYHPRIDLAVRAFADAGSRPTHVIAAFSIPPLPPDNFRNHAAPGGGVLNDLGPYAVTIGRTFFGETAAVEELAARSLSTNAEVDTGFSLMAIYPEGRSVVGLFTYTTAYINRVDVAGPGLLLTLDRVFSPPATLATDLVVRAGDETRTITVPPADTFALFFDDLFRAMARGDHEPFARRLLADAELRARLRHAALGAHAGT